MLAIQRGPHQQLLCASDNPNVPGTDCTYDGGMLIFVQPHSFSLLAVASSQFDQGALRKDMGLCQ